jgi:LPXTG-site transpeptidase (sortase) family protein
VQTPPPAPPGLVPTRLRIPKIGVDAVVEEVSVDSTGSMGVPTRPMDVGWYSPGSAPGQPGDAVIDGHLDWYGVPRAVFYDLDQLRSGDEIDVQNGNGQVRFAVTNTETLPYTAQPDGLFDTTGAARLSLITCSGAWDSRHGTYAQRLLVTARPLATS